MEMKHYESLRTQFRQLFEATWDPEELENYEDLREKFAYHMAEIAENLTAMAQVYADPKACDVSCIKKRTELFFNDCVPHLMAAAQIYGDIPQIFKEQQGVHDWESFTDEEA